jgi:hypothetical protein
LGRRKNMRIYIILTITAVFLATFIGCEQAPVSHKGKTQITIIFTATPDLVAEGDRIFASHAKWMERTHYREGELALLRYNLVKGPELSHPMDPSSEPTGNTSFVLTEVYENPAGHLFALVVQNNVCPG